MTHPDYYDRSIGGYRQIAEDIHNRILAGEWTRYLPGLPELADIYNVAYQTVRNAVKLLETNGVVITAHGKKTVIISNDEPTIAEAIKRVSKAMEELADTRQYLINLSHKLDHIETETSA